MPDLNKMTLDDILEYCKERELWIMGLFVHNEGMDNARRILIENNKL